MDHKALAAEIYALPHNQRAKRLAELKPPHVGMVKAYVDQIGKKAKAESRKRYDGHFRNSIARKG